MPPRRSIAIQRRSGDGAAAIDVPSVSVTSTSRTTGMSCAASAITLAAAMRVRRGVMRVNAKAAETATLSFSLRSLAAGLFPRCHSAGARCGRGDRARCASGRGSRPGGRGARGFQRGGALDDRREHRPRVAPLRGTVRLPDRRGVLGEDVLEIAVALDTARRELRDVEVAGPFVAMLDQ